MKKLLLIGIDTRSMLNSALKLDFEIYSVSYFSTSDTPQIKNQKIILNESDGESCGIFEDQFDSRSILELSSDYIDEADYIIAISGVSPSDFKKSERKKILGTVDVEDIENKYRFYKKIRNEFLTPMTFNVNDMDEAIEINKNYEDIQFILKPLQGSGGYDISLLDNNSNITINKGEFILQEYVKGTNLSSSLLATENDVKCVMNTRLLCENDFAIKDSFRYIGNIMPLTDKSLTAGTGNIKKINENMAETSQNIAQKFNLIGSNGIDYILNEKGLYTIEINPRIQGTFESMEMSLGINMLDAHIMACLGELVEIPKPKYYSYKKIIYSPARMKYEKIDLNNIYDLPHIGSITEKSQPLLTIIDKDKSFENLVEKVESSSKKVNGIAKRHLQDT